MDRTGGVDRSGMTDPERQAKIAQIEDRNRANFTTWITEPDHSQSLDLNPKAAQYLIPTRLLEIASDPTKVKVVILDSDSTWLQFAIVEAMDHPVSDLDTFEDLHHPLSPNESGQRPPFPSNVHPLHYQLMSHVDKGTIGLDEKPYYWITLQKYGDDEVFVEHINDTSETRGQQVVTGFYENLQKIAKESGFRYITGENSLPDPTAEDPLKKRGNIGYFLSRFNRLPLGKLPKDMQETFQQKHGNELSKETFTVDFLYPEDKPTSST